MPPLELVRDDTLITFDGTVVEVFRKIFDKSLRVPAAWVGVEVTTDRHGNVALHIGTADTPGAAVYGPDVSILGNYWPVEIPPAEEPNYRAFFAQVAAAAGRSVA